MAVVRLGPNGEVEVIEPGTQEERAAAEAAVLRIAGLLGEIAAREDYDRAVREHRARAQRGEGADGMIFRDTPYVRPTQEQYALLGEAVVDWSIIDYQVEGLIARLVRAPDFPMLAVTKRLGSEARNSALDALAEMHDLRYGHRALPEQAVRNIAQIRKRLKQLKPLRNRVAHWIWMRSNDDEMFGTPLLGRVPKGREDGGVILTNAALRAHLKELPKLAALIEETLNGLPEVSEESLLDRS